MATIQLKRGRIADIVALNPIPAEGEIIVDLDSLKFKIGDGARAWSDLPYANVLTDLGSTQTGTSSPTFNSNTANLWVSPPTSATSNGIAGQIAYDSSYIYICVSNNVWARAELATW